MPGTVMGSGDTGQREKEEEREKERESVCVFLCSWSLFFGQMFLIS